jgi:pyridoxamine 5'-phosphate oxidase-like protein
VNPEPRAGRPDMPAYGILPADGGEGLLPWAWAEQRLRDAHTYWVATTRIDGAPHAAPVWALWFDDAVVFSTSARSRKAANLARDARCVVSIERDDTAVIVEGDAGTLAPERRHAYDAAYADKYAFDISEMTDPLFVVRPRVVFGFIDSANRFSATATRWTFAH